MANDPRKTVKSYCPTKEQEKTKEKADFFGSLKKFGGLELFNKVGMGKVGEGLRAITGTADVIRLGGSTNIPSTVNKGANWVLDKVGVDGASFNALTAFNPGVANRAYDQAAQIWQRTKDGNFSLKDIPTMVADVQNAANLVKSIFPGKQDKDKPGLSGPEMCDPSPYAMDLIQYAPKFKFLFVVDIKYTDPYRRWNVFSSPMAFVVQTATRPHYDIEYEEVNMYNFWTNVPKRVKYSPMTMTFLDDNMNNTHLFYTSYMRAISPIANIDGKLGDGRTDLFQGTSMAYGTQNQQNTFDTYGGPPLNNQYAASLGLLLDNRTSIIDHIKLYHVFGYGSLMNVFTFRNPRITSMELTDLDMKESGLTDLKMDFVYDNLFVDAGVSLANPEEKSNIEMLTGFYGKFALSPVFGNDTDPKKDQPNAPLADEQKKGQGGILAGAKRFVNTAVDKVGNITQGIQDAMNAVGDEFQTTLKSIADNASNNVSAIKDTIFGNKSSGV